MGTNVPRLRLYRPTSSRVCGRLGALGPFHPRITPCGPSIPSPFVLLKPDVSLRKLWLVDPCCQGRLPPLAACETKPPKTPRPTSLMCAGFIVILWASGNRIPWVDKHRPSSCHPRSCQPLKGESVAEREAESASGVAVGAERLQQRITVSPLWIGLGSPGSRSGATTCHRIVVEGRGGELISHWRSSIVAEAPSVWSRIVASSLTVRTSSMDSHVPPHRIGSVIVGL